MYQQQLLKNGHARPREHPLPQTFRKPSILVSIRFHKPPSRFMLPKPRMSRLTSVDESTIWLAMKADIGLLQHNL